MFSISDIASFVQKLEAINQSISSTSKSISSLALKFSSQTFENKSYEVKSVSNFVGESLVVREIADRAQQSHIFIDVSNVNNLIEAVRNVMQSA